MTAYTLASGSLAPTFARACGRLDEVGFADALWSRRLDVWTKDAAVQQKIGNRLGWLDTLDLVSAALPRLRAFAAGLGADGITDVVLLGMGGSSLAPEVMRQVLGTAPGQPRFRMLDSVDPAAVRAAMASAPSSLFLFASKSGSTIEPNVMAAEAKRRLVDAGIAPPGSRFAAVTDPDTDLYRRATAERFREVFLNPPDIGGRYSALSFFGMVPAALLGADVDKLLASAREMAAACHITTAQENPGLALGAFMAAGAEVGRDKLTLLVPERLRSFGLWVEQLVAESTGKQGKGIVPIAGEAGDAAFGDDRVGVVITIGGETPDPAIVERAAAAGMPTVTLHMREALDIGAEFFRWEVATAAAGYLLGINPFDEPNVQQAKDATRALLDVYRQRRQLPRPEPDAAFDGVRLTLSAAAQDSLSGQPAETFLRVVGEGDYVGLLVYLPPEDATFDPLLRDLRARLGAKTGRATMFGYGPRYLHSTGQLHKGGANNGVFVVLAAEPTEDLEVPGETFSFGVLEMAQAIGDFQSLDRTGRRAIFVHLPRRDPDLIRRVAALLT